MKHLLTAIALLLTATQAHALVDGRIKRYVTAAELLAGAPPTQVVLGYALDNDTLYFYNGTAWVAASSLTEPITGATSLDASDCGKTFFVTDDADGDAISLPATIAGCEYRFVFVGSDGGALVDISPAAADAVHGSCTLASSVLELSGSDGADFGFTKSTINTGDRVSIIGDGSVGWFITECAGILANN